MIKLLSTSKIKFIVFIIFTTLVVTGVNAGGAGMVTVDFVEVDRMNVSTFGSDSAVVYDFTGGEILNGSRKWKTVRQGDLISEIFLGSRRLFHIAGPSVTLVSEENRDKYLRYEPVLPVSGTDSDSVMFTARGRYCRTEGISEAGVFNSSAHPVTVILTPGDTLRNVEKRDLTFDYRGALGPEADARLATDTLEIYRRAVSYFTVGASPEPVAVILTESVCSPDGSDKVEYSRYFADVQRSIDRKNDDDEESITASNDTLGEFSVSFSNGIIEVTTTSVPRDGQLAVMDKAGNIFYSRHIESNASVSINTSGLPFGQYIVSLSSVRAGKTVKRIVFVR